MTIDDSVRTRSMFPFICQFAEPLPRVAPYPVRYDAARQIAQVLVGTTWVDTPDARLAPMLTTRSTRVQAETTDDE